MLHFKKYLKDSESYIVRGMRMVYLIYLEKVTGPQRMDTRSEKLNEAIRLRQERV